MKTKLLSLLALMLTAVSGAWADSFSADAYAVNATLNGVSVTANQTVTINKDVTVTVNNGLTISTGVTLTVTGGGTLVVNGTTGANGSDGYIDTYQESPFDPPVDIFVQPTAGGNGGAAITINSGAQLALSNATVIANGGQGGTGINGLDIVKAANGANGNGFSSFPTIDGAVLSYSTNGTDYTEYASGNSTLYRYMKAVAVAPATTYSATLKEGTEDAANWSITPNEGLNENDQVTIKYSGSNMVKSIKVKKVAAPEPEEDFVTFSDGTNTVKVAKMNLGATSVADGTSSYGDYYAWGATTTSTEYLEENAPYFDSSTWEYTAYINSGEGKAALTTLEAADDAVAANMPGYHMPTQAEFQTLYDACGGSFSGSTPTYDTKGIYWVAGATSAVTIGGDEYKANGMLFVQDADTHVFFPAAGYVSDTTLDGVGSYGLHWSSSLYTDPTTNAYILYFDSNSVYPGSHDGRYLGFPVRPFKD